MPLYIPVDIDVQLVASHSDLVAFRWAASGISADFIIPDDPLNVLRVTFAKQCIVRLLDEMPLSTEEDDSPNEGLRHEHFAYKVEGAIFARSQSEAWKLTFGVPIHWRFVTGWACMDVLSSAEPTFKRESVDG
jgi:hypothetical protein